MQARAQLKYLRVTPQKARMVADLVRGKAVQKALDILHFSKKGVSVNIRKLLKSAIANAEENHKLDPDRLSVARICVDDGPILKRFSPRARGSADQVHKKSCHVTIVLEDK